eukprot:CAMPEP_0113895830 /NCGR_PEP_ID=MMETSP0780_2-20120614/17613_1 /TAXON_ID=652834 /ORGANISM="Palpitomonas bilix" /LENGTH=1054 /DNA_ID=CAMNT_0000886769 /DNA_START=34 /DNA_END=3198 /DNA_ORIENTATION=- /assembly_acc=CAM_ASM_000599
MSAGFLDAIADAAAEATGDEVFPPRPFTVLRDFPQVYCNICGGNKRQEDLLRCEVCHDELHFDCAGLKNEGGEPALCIEELFLRNGKGLNGMAAGESQENYLDGIVDRVSPVQFDFRSPILLPLSHELSANTPTFVCVDCMPYEKWQALASLFLAAPSMPDSLKFALLRTRSHVYVREGAGRFKSPRTSASRFRRQSNYTDAIVIQRLREGNIPMVRVGLFDGTQKVVSPSEIQLAKLPASTQNLYSIGSLVFLKKEVAVRNKYLRHHFPDLFGENKGEVDSNEDGQEEQETGKERGEKKGNNRMDVDDDDEEIEGEAKGRNGVATHDTNKKAPSRRKRKQPYPLCLIRRDEESDEPDENKEEKETDPFDAYFQPAEVTRVTLAAASTGTDNDTADSRYVYEIEKKDNGGIYVVEECDLCPPTFMQEWWQNGIALQCDDERQLLARKRVKNIAFSPIPSLKSALAEYGFSPAFLPRLVGDFASITDVLAPVEKETPLSTILSLYSAVYHHGKQYHGECPTPDDLMKAVNGVPRAVVCRFLTSVTARTEAMGMNAANETLSPVFACLYRHWMHYLAMQVEAKMSQHGRNIVNITHTFTEQVDALVHLLEFGWEHFSSQVSFRRLRGFFRGTFSMYSALSTLVAEECLDVSTLAHNGERGAGSGKGHPKKKAKLGHTEGEGVADGGRTGNGSSTTPKKGGSESTSEGSKEGAALSLEEEGEEEKMEMAEAEKGGCEICGKDHSPDRTIVCDGCDAEYHFDCLVPAITEVPDGDWYCSDCWDMNKVAECDRKYKESAPYFVPRFLGLHRQSDGDVFKATRESARGSFILSLRRQMHVVARWGAKKKVYDAVIKNLMWRGDNVFADVMYFVDNSSSLLHCDNVRLPLNVTDENRDMILEGLHSPASSNSTPTKSSSVTRLQHKIEESLQGAVLKRGDYVRLVKPALGFKLNESDRNMILKVVRVTIGAQGIYAEVTERLPEGVRRGRVRAVFPIDTVEKIEVDESSGEVLKRGKSDREGKAGEGEAVSGSSTPKRQHPRRSDGRGRRGLSEVQPIVVD